jgi:hypothetical protein
MLSSRAVDRVLGIQTDRLIALGLLTDSSPLDSWSPAAPDAAPGALPRPRRWTVSVIGDTAGEKKSVARRSTGLDYSSSFAAASVSSVAIWVTARQTGRAPSRNCLATSQTLSSKQHRCSEPRRSAGPKITMRWSGKAAGCTCTSVSAGTTHCDARRACCCSGSV